MSDNTFTYRGFNEGNNFAPLSKASMMSLYLLNSQSNSCPLYVYLD